MNRGEALAVACKKKLEEEAGYDELPLDVIRVAVRRALDPHQQPVNRMQALVFAWIDQGVV